MKRIAWEAFAPLVSLTTLLHPQPGSGTHQGRMTKKWSESCERPPAWQKGSSAIAKGTSSSAYAFSSHSSIGAFKKHPPSVGHSTGKSPIAIVTSCNIVALSVDVYLKDKHMVKAYAISLNKDVNETCCIEILETGAARKGGLRVYMCATNHNWKKTNNRRTF